MFGHILVNFGKKIKVDSVLETGESRASIKRHGDRFTRFQRVLGWNPKRDVCFFVSNLPMQKIHVFFEPRPKVLY